MIRYVGCIKEFQGNADIINGLAPNIPLMDLVQQNVGGKSFWKKKKYFK